MSTLAWVGLTAAVAVVLIAVLAVGWRFPSAAELRAWAQLPHVEIDPFHALTAVHRYTGAMDDAAVATLLHDGLVTIDTDGMLTVTDRGHDPAHAPAHPVPAAWL